MLDDTLIRENVDTADAVVAKLLALGYSDRQEAGRMGADLGDIYTAAAHVRSLINDLLQTSADSRDDLAVVLADLHEELEHLRSHIDSSLENVDDLAGRFDLTH